MDSKEDNTKTIFTGYEYNENNVNDIKKNELDISMLSQEQKYAYNKFKSGENIFITGPGGTGKTKLIKYFVEYARYIGEHIQVCAMTGCAAILLNCNARTIHSWSGIRLAKGQNEDIVRSVLNNKKACKNWRRAKILVLDEVSMLSKKVFEILEEIARQTKKSRAPFGGMQVVFSGDFCQLPPVGSYGDTDTYKFCFESLLWNTVFPERNCIEFTTIFRQSDTAYAKILNGIRKGIITKSSNNILKECLNKEYDEKKHNGCIPTKLFPLRSKADHYNNLMYEKLNSTSCRFELIKTTNNNTFLDSGQPIPMPLLQACRKLSSEEIEFELNQLINSSPCVQVLQLKIGAAVMCNVNLDMDRGICNGSQGVIIDIIKRGSLEIPVVKFANGLIKHISPYDWQSEEFPTISISQYPLCLSWALTIHKIQGATLDIAEIDVGNSIFEYGQTYVALSRVKSVEGLYLSAFMPEKIQTNPLVIQFYKNFKKIDDLNDIIEPVVDTNIKKIKI